MYFLKKTYATESDFAAVWRIQWLKYQGLFQPMVTWITSVIPHDWMNQLSFELSREQVHLNPEYGPFENWRKLCVKTRGVICELGVVFPWNFPFKQHIIYLCKTTSSALETRSNKKKRIIKTKKLKLLTLPCLYIFEPTLSFESKFTLTPVIHLYQTKGRDT